MEEAEGEENERVFTGLWVNKINHRQAGVGEFRKRRSGYLAIHSSGHEREEKEAIIEPSNHAPPPGTSVGIRFMISNQSEKAATCEMCVARSRGGRSEPGRAGGHEEKKVANRETIRDL